MVILPDRYSCTGCTACDSVCEVGAIKMIEDAEGFKQPQITEDKCIDCNMCVDVCPVYSNTENVHSSIIEKECFAAISSDESLRLASSSGGLFTELASHVLKSNGFVYGALFDENLVVKHSRASTIEGLIKFRGSKYVQSDLSDTFIQIADDLKAGSTVLFSGVPCQIAGLIEYLSIENISKSNLLLVDIICHGVPSPLIWRSYLAYLKHINNSHEITHISFRGKSDGWHAKIKIDYFLTGNMNQQTDYSFIDLFLYNYILRPCCHSCKYANTNRLSDITLGDFWGIENTALSCMDDDKGVSAVIINTEVGVNIFTQIRHKILYNKSSLLDIVPSQQTLVKPFPPHKNREWFWNEFYRSGYASAKNVITDNFKAGEFTNDRFDFTVIAPDGAGSKGDEALIRGVLDILFGSNVNIITPSDRPWSPILMDKISDFSEQCIDLDKIALTIDYPTKLIIMGTDMIDGTCGLDSSMSRLNVVENNIKHGGESYIFCSFRSSCRQEILDKIISIGSKPHYFLRDEISLLNFKTSTKLEAVFFPDFAFFSTSINTDYSTFLLDAISKVKQHKTIVGINFSDFTFKSLYAVHDMHHRFLYVRSVIDSVLCNIDEPLFVLMSHDTRQTNDVLSDYDYQILSKKYFDELQLNSSYIFLKEDINHEEIVSLLKNIDLLICARMHLSVAAFKSGLPPIVYTGNGDKGLPNMIDKVRGMYKNHTGDENWVVSNIDSLVKILFNYKSTLPRIKIKLEDYNQSNIKILQKSKEFLRDMLRVNINPENHLESSATSSISEINKRFQMIVSSHRNSINNLTAWVNLLIISERNLNHQLSLSDSELLIGISRISGLEQELNSIYSSKGYRALLLVKKIINRLLPRYSKRRKIVKVLVYKPLKLSYKATRYLYHNGLLKFFQRCFIYPIEKIFCDKKVLVVEHTYLDSLNLIKAVPEKIELPKFDGVQVSIIVPVYNQYDYTMRSLESIRLNSCDVKYEVIIADDNSTDETVRIADKVTNLNHIKNESNLGFLMNCNNAAKFANGKYILFLNNDTQVLPNWLAPLVSKMEQDKTIGLIGSKLIYPDGTLQEAGGIVWSDASSWNFGRDDNPNKPEYNYLREVDYISGASIMISKQLWNEIGGFDERYIPAYFEDTDLAFEVRKVGYKVVLQPRSVVVHFEGKSHGNDINKGVKKFQEMNKKKFIKKWKSALMTEHFFNAQNVFHAKDRSRNKKTILYIDHYVPEYDKDAGSRVTLYYLSILLSLDFNVKFIGDNFANPEPYTSKLQQMGIEVLYGNYYANNFKKYLAENSSHIDFSIICRPHIASKYIDIIKQKTNAKIIYFGHDLHYVRTNREYEIKGDIELLNQSKYWKDIEIALMNKSDKIITVSSAEKEVINSEIGKDNCYAVPMFNFENFSDANVSELANKKDIMFIGGFSHTPNIDGVKWFVDNVWQNLLHKLPDIKLYILGSNPPIEITQLSSNNIIVTGYISDDELERYYNSCRVAVIPLRYGAGVKGKTIEAMYHHIGTVSTSIGLEGIEDIENYQTSYDTAEEFLKRVFELYTDESKLLENMNNNQTYLKNYYSRKRVSDIFMDLLS